MRYRAEDFQKDFWVNIGKRIRLRREQFGLTRDQLSYEIGVSEKTLGQIERGEHGCSVARLFMIASKLNISVDRLLKGTPNELPQNYDVRISAREDTSARYNPSDDWPLRPPIAMYFNALVNDFMREWLVRQQEYLSKQITRDEYFEWKLNWPDTCDDLGKATPTIQWRKNK